MKANLILATGLFLCSLPVQAEPSIPPRPITLTADLWCPYNCDPADKNAEGFLVEFARKALEPLGFTLTYTTQPWSRAIKDVTAGTIDILIATDPVENPQLLMADALRLPCSFKLFTLPDKTFSYEGTHSLVDHRLGAIDEYLYSEEVNAYMSSNRHHQEHIQILAGDNALERNIKKLLHNRIDVLVENPSVLHYKMKTMGISQTFAVTGNIDQNDRMCYLGVSPNIPHAKELTALLNQRAQQLEADGTIQTLRTKYSME